MNKEDNDKSSCCEPINCCCGCIDSTKLASLLRHMADFISKND